MEAEARAQAVPRHRNSLPALVRDEARWVLLAGRLLSSAGTTARSAAIIAAATPDNPATVETRASHLTGAAAVQAAVWADRAGVVAAEA